MQDHLAVHQESYREWLPVGVPDGTWAWGSGDSHRGIELCEDQGLWIASLYDCSPLLPKSRLAVVPLVLFRCQRCFVAGCLVRFNLRPGTRATSELDLFLLLLNITIACDHQVAAHFLQAGSAPSRVT